MSGVRDKMSLSPGSRAITRAKNKFNTSESSINDAIQKGYFQQVRFLIELGYSVNEVQRHGRTPLMSCALVEDDDWGVGLARLLLEKGASLKPRDNHGLNALHYACIYERVGLVRLFLKANDFKLNQQDCLGNTALHYSATNGNVGITRMLTETLVRFKGTVDIKNLSGVTPLLYAWKTNHPDCAKLLVELGGAAQDIVDPQVNKCSRDYEIDLLAEANANEEEQMKSSDVQKNGQFNLPRYMKPLTGLKKRAQSAPSGGRKNKSLTLSRPTSSSSRTLNATSSHDNNKGENSMISKGDISLRLYRNAGYANPRNIPERVFKSNTLQCFNENITQSFRVKSRGSPAIEDEKPVTGWRAEVKALFNTYDFQWSESYRKSIIPPPESSPSPSGEEGDELWDLRPSSPFEIDGSRRHSRRYGGFKNLNHALGGIGDGGPGGARMGRRSSIVSNGGRSRRGSVASVTSQLVSEPHSGSSSDGSTKKKSKSRSWKN